MGEAASILPVLMARWAIAFLFILPGLSTQPAAPDSVTLRHWLSDGAPREAAWAAFYSG